MPRDGTGNYTKPFPDVVDGTTIESIVHNGTIADIETDLNEPRPIVAGGTGGNNAMTARDNLDAEVAGQVVTNYNSHSWENGSFSSDAGATGAPVAGRYFVGTCQKLTSDPVNYITLVARIQDSATPRGVVYTRQKIGGVWQAWEEMATSVTTGNKSFIGNDFADMSFGLNGPAPNSYFFVDAESDTGGPTLFSVAKNGNSSFFAPTGALTISYDMTASGYTDFDFKTGGQHRFLQRTGDNTLFLYTCDADGVVAGTALSIDRATARTTVPEPTAAGHIASKNYVDTTTVSLAGDTMTGNLSIATPTNPSLVLQGTGVTPCNIFGGHNGISRWVMQLGNGATESGGNNGSDFVLSRCDDGSGAVIDTPLGITRSNGRVSARLGLDIGTGTPSQNTRAEIDYAAGGQFGLTFRPAADGSTPVLFVDAANAVVVGTISTTGTTTAYNTSSDDRLKQDLQSFDAGRIVDDTLVYNFAWKTTGKRSYGVSAQQASKVYPEAVTHLAEQDWWGVDYSKYIPVILQELKALRQRVAELEGTPAAKPA